MNTVFWLICTKAPLLHVLVLSVRNKAAAKWIVIEEWVTSDWSAGVGWVPDMAALLHGHGLVVVLV